MTSEVVKALASPGCYVTGVSALCIHSYDSFPALWYSSSLRDPDSWQLAGVHIDGASEILGAEGIWDASEILLHYVVGSQRHTIMAATHERAVFDLMFHFCHLRQREILNFGFSDIDDVVEKAVIVDWIDSNELRLDPHGVQLMKKWLNRS